LKIDRFYIFCFTNRPRLQTGRARSVSAKQQNLITNALRIHPHCKRRRCKYCRK